MLCQADFATELLKACKAAGLHTAIESAASTSYSEIEKLLPYLDLYLMDIKLIDPQKHKEYTGVDNALILENARRIANSGIEVIVRTPIVPTVNDNAEEVRAISRFAKSLGTVREHHLLPYHRLGQDKYSGLGRSYSFNGVEPPSREKMEYLLSVAEETGLKCQIGG